MSQEFHYGWEGVDTDLGTEVARLGEYGGYSLKAWAGEIGNCELIFDDPDNDLPDSGLEGLGNLWVMEDACDDVGADGVNGKRLFSGYIGERTYSRGDSARSSLRVGSNRQVSVALSDLNVVASFMLFHTASANRPAETDVERVQWLLSDPDRPLWSATDAAGYVDTSNPVNMDACDYTGQSPQQVLGDCAVASGKNWFIGYWEATGDAFLWYADSNTSTAFTSLLRISNDLDDIDTASDWTTWTTFPPKLGTDAKLVRTPDRRYKGVLVNFANGTAYKTNSDAALGYAWRDGSAPNGNVSTQTAADALAQRLADDATGEEDRVTCTVQLPASLATGIKAGQRIDCKFTHLPGYETGRWMRVTGLQIAQDEATDARYTLTLDLTPQALLPSIAQFNWGVNAGAPNPHFETLPAIGSTVVISLNSYNNEGPATVPAGWTQISTETGFLPPDENTSLWLYSCVSDGTQTYDETNGLQYPPSGFAVRWAIWELDGVGPTPSAVTRVYDRTDTDAMSMTATTPTTGGGVGIYVSGSWTAFGPVTWVMAAPYDLDKLTDAGAIPRMTWGHHVFGTTGGSDTGMISGVTGVQWGGYLAIFVP